MPLHHARDRHSDLAPIERVGAVLRNQSQSPGLIGILYNISDLNLPLQSQMLVVVLGGGANLRIALTSRLETAHRANQLWVGGEAF